MNLSKLLKMVKDRQAWCVHGGCKELDTTEKNNNVYRISCIIHIRNDSGFFGGGDAREYPGGLLRLDPAFAYAEPPSS